MQPQAGLFIGLHAHDANTGERFAETAPGSTMSRWASQTGRCSWPGSSAWPSGTWCTPPSPTSSYGSVLVFRDPDNIQLEFIAPAQG